MDERRNHYRVLGVQPDASGWVIRAAWRTAMQKLRAHPDLGGDHATAIALNRAYHVLRHPGRRARYDEQLLTQWTRVELAGHRGSAPLPQTQGHGNRRNYYRVLGVQPDAPEAIINATYRALSNDDGVDQGLIDEALAVLADQHERNRYDRWLRGEPEPEMAVTVASSGYCPFCRALHAEYPRSQQARPCHDCGSPLGTAMDESARDDARLAVETPVEVRLPWPSQVLQGTVADLAPGGLGIRVGQELELDAIVRLTTTGFDAVARVVHRLADDAGVYHGVQFVTVAYADAVVIDTAC